MRVIGKNIMDVVYGLAYHGQYWACLHTLKNKIWFMMAILWESGNRLL